MTQPLDPHVTRFLFEGEMLTVRQVHQIVPAVALGTVRRLLQQGYSDRFQLMDGIPALRAEGRRKQRANSHLYRPRV
jgi:hypothetical protein